MPIAPSSSPADGGGLTNRFGVTPAHAKQGSGASPAASAAGYPSRRRDISIDCDVPVAASWSTRCRAGSRGVTPWFRLD